jgi:hypothetical protein
MAEHTTAARMVRALPLNDLSRRVATLTRRIPLALAILVVVAVALRAALWVVYQPAGLNLADTIRYVDMAKADLFMQGSPHPGGYPMFLRALHAISSDLDLTIAVQHLLGIATGLLLYVMVRRVGAPRWVGAVAAAAVLLSLDQVFLEHTIMTETLFTFAVTVLLYACVRVLDDPRPLAGEISTRHAWIAAAGVALGLTAWVRTVGAPLIPFLVLWLALAIPGTARARVGRAVLGGGVATGVLLLYLSLNAASTGHFGLTKFDGWALYSRSAPFADCSQFEPPPGTEQLCEATPADARPGPDFYTWDPQSPAHRALGGFPPTTDTSRFYAVLAARNDELGAFAREVIVHQPRAYASAVLHDFIRYFIPGISARAWGGTGYGLLDADRRAGGWEEGIHGVLNRYYIDEEVSIRPGIGVVGDIQRVLRITALPLLVAVTLAGIGLVLARSSVRALLALLLGASLLLLAISSATLVYQARFAVTVTGPLIAAGAIGLWLIADRWLTPRRDVSA